MSKIVRLDKENYDLWLTYSWSGTNHGICGHTFEVLDYFLLLKKYFRVGIFLAEDIDWPMLEKSILSKYDLSSQEIALIKENTVFADRPKLVSCKNILFTDGGVINLRDKTILADHIFHFACGNKEIKENKKENTYILQDERIYEKCFNSINYKKKINFAHYKKIEKSSDDFMLYGTKNCREISTELSEELLEKYDNKFLWLVNKENAPKNPPKRFEVLDLPVENLFERFGTYVYTSVPRKFDCSPRFIAECKFYNKDVIYHNIDYWDEDKGLYWRKWDIDNDFNSLFLNDSDELIGILKERI